MLTPKSSGPARPTPQRLLDAAETLMRTTGLANATTKAIAREAGCSEAALYKHFANKEELFVRVLLERTPNAGALMAALTADPGERVVAERLADIAGHAARFYADTMPIAGSLFAEPALLSRHREGLREIGMGPHVVLDALVDCLRREREHGRIRADADPRAAASLLLGACFQRAFFLHFSGPASVQPVAEFAPAVAGTVWAAIR
ncbi:TetR/AcrR family transcriptional regulator [Streptomyces sp. NBC_00536]|uniref:TetR/AcrR family transcriptional regulator n=1 Tax=Streptomyces sp. NBC_00536 TaxID=2975769 RepID=UPI002E7FD162|nr:TetR/AcrR family transcriptional regulator [Streptomyces sp. NBC_00536]WUC78430.1 TetR/AcrR family transcriptional regulator [Streptomyces sp. NBC_00536]